MKNSLVQDSEKVEENGDQYSYEIGDFGFVQVMIEAH